MESAIKTLFFGFNPKVMSHSHQTVNVEFPKLNRRSDRFRASRTHRISARDFAGELYPRSSHRCSPRISAVLSGAKDVEASSSQLGGFSVNPSDVNQPGELKISVEVSGTLTKTVFDKVFEKMVAAAQPIPGFRRVKGGKTPDIPKHILLEVLGHSKVLKQVIKQIINSTIAEYVEKEGLKVSKDLSVEQSFEELESTFEPGETFNFDSVLKLRE